MEESLIENDVNKIPESLTATVLDTVEGTEIPEATEAQCVEGSVIRDINPIRQDNEIECRGKIQCLLVGCCIGGFIGLNCPVY